jgi:hypothetical protein
VAQEIPVAAKKSKSRPSGGRPVHIVGFGHEVNENVAQESAT